MPSQSFDRAADFYDATREISPEQLSANIEILSKETQDKEPVLELGIGTGRIGVPFASTGRSIVGFDISTRMLKKLREKSVAVPIAQADATRMPFPDRTFGCAYAMWVLHLISDWPAALLESVRVVRPGGVILVTIGGVQGFGPGPGGEMMADLRAAAGIERNIGATTLEEIDDFMREIGIEGRDAGEVRMVNEITPAEILRRIRANVFSFTWPLNEDVRQRAADEIETKARDRYGDLEVPLANEFVTRWRAFDVA